MLTIKSTHYETFLTKIILDELQNYKRISIHLHINPSLSL